MSFEIEGLTIAVTNMDAMKAFYGKLFNIEWQTQNIDKYTLYSGEWGGLKLLLCPAILAQNEATQNRHQFDILVENLDRTLLEITENGGAKMGEVVQYENFYSVGIYDPDQNSLVLKQRILKK